MRFLAKELSKLPPVTFDYVDVTPLLKDITTLKAEMNRIQSRMEASEKSNAELRVEIALLRNVVSVTGSPEASKVNTSRGAKNASISRFESTNTSASLAANIADQALPADAVTRAATSAAETSHVGTMTPKRAYVAVVTTGMPCTSQPKRPAKIGDKVKQSTQRTLTVVRSSLKQAGQVDEEGFTRVEKKKRRSPVLVTSAGPIVIGGTAPSGPNMLLRPAVPTTQLYISRLHHSTKVEEVVEYMRVKTNWTLRVERLDSRHDINFKSFVIRVPTQQLQTFLREEFWPKGVLYRRFRGRLRDTTQRNTTPMLRV
ncbi:hypothetical protein PYW08_007871 [Mythimna loreyi]|uniref:Uncharacterized protein n=1 Tax=Mythimna loreyi TaxID=667449 RepID=A0ACC2QE07_9NEOP|nr:hypothetical protein PYW08_007871 [Mythimna loreyi]